MNDLAESVTGTRIHHPIEDLELPEGEFKGTCTHCEGYVLVPRHPETLRLRPEDSHCCFCGQRYRVSGGAVAVEQAHLEE